MPILSDEMIDSKRIEAAYDLGVKSDKVIHYTCSTESSCTDCEKYLAKYAFEIEVQWLRENNRYDEIRIMREHIANDDLDKLRHCLYLTQQDMVTDANEKTKKVFKMSVFSILGAVAVVCLITII